MILTIEITSEVYSRLEKLVVGFENPSNVISRLLDSFEKNKYQPEITKPISSYEVATKSNNNRLYSNREIQRRISSVAKSLEDHELEQLCNDSISKDLFGISFPLFIKVPSTENQATKKKAVQSSDGVNRWTWKFEFIRNGFSYAICTQWYPKNDNFVQQWLSTYE